MEELQILGLLLWRRQKNEVVFWTARQGGKKRNDVEGASTIFAD